MNCELPDVQAGFRKGRGIGSNCEHPLDPRKSKGVPEKKSTSTLLTMPKPLTVWITAAAKSLQNPPSLGFSRQEHWSGLPFSSPIHERKLLSHVRLLATPWTAAYQAPPFMGFSRQEYWNGVPLPSPKDLMRQYAATLCH